MHVMTLSSCDLTSLTLTTGPVLLGASEKKPDQTVNWQALPVHRDEEQVKLDVHRAFVYYPTGMQHMGLRHMHCANIGQANLKTRLKAGNMNCQISSLVCCVSIRACITSRASTTLRKCCCSCWAPTRLHLSWPACLFFGSGITCFLPSRPVNHMYSYCLQ